MEVNGNRLFVTSDAKYGAADSPYTIAVTVPAQYTADNKSITRSVTLTVEGGDVPVLKSIPVPTANTGLKWTGQEQTGVNEGEGYTLTGHKATTVGSYEAIATLQAGYQWTGSAEGPQTIKWSIDKAVGPAAPSNLHGTAPTAAGTNDGKITGTTAAMEYAANENFDDAQSCADTETTGLASGTYHVRLKETATHEAGQSVQVSVPAASEIPGPGDGDDGDGDKPGGDGDNTDGDKPGGDGDNTDGDKPGGDGDNTEGNKPGGDSNKPDGDNSGSGSGSGSGSSGGSSSGGSTQEPVISPQQTANEINAAGSGSTISMTLPSSNTVSRTVWQALAGKDVYLEITSGRFSWSVHGRDVDPKALPTSLNLGAKEGMNLIPSAVLEQMPHGSETLQLSLNHNGNFAVPLTLSVDLGRDNAQRWANLYYYNTQEKTMEFQSASLIGDHGRASFPMTHASSYAVVVDQNSHRSEGTDDPFLDVSIGAWYYDVVRYVYQNGIMTGTGRDTFSPLSLTTRGQVAATLYRMAGSPAPGAAVSFRDVAPGSYYEDAVCWAVNSGVATGHSAEIFAPDAPITREQLAALLYRYAQNVERERVNPSAQSLARFPDQGRVSAYAVQPMAWAVERGLIDGFQDGTLQPQGQTSRAQLAAVLARFAQR